MILVDYESVLSGARQVYLRREQIRRQRLQFLAWVFIGMGLALAGWCAARAMYPS